jgi:membrane fusion protein (multidrug efflux system)
LRPILSSGVRLLVAAATCCCTAFVEPEAANGSALVKLATVTSGSVNPSVRGYGTVAADPNHLVALALPRDIVASAVSVRVGQLVKPGDVIATVTTAPAVISTFQQARDAVTFAEKDLAHARYLFGLRLATNSQVAAAEKARADAQAQLQAQIRIGADRSTETVRASTPGIVMAVNAAPGQPIQANAVIASIVPRDRLLVNVGLEPEDAVKVRAGSPVSFHSPQNQTIVFTGRVSSVDVVTDPKSRLVNAVATVPPAAAADLTVGMVLEATLDLPPRTGFRIPHSALMNDGNGPYVFVVNQGIAHRRPVQIALSTDADALISQGLSAGESVVIAGNAGLSDGTPVRVG